MPFSALEAPQRVLQVQRTLNRCLLYHDELSVATLLPYKINAGKQKIRDMLTGKIVLNHVNR